MAMKDRVVVVQCQRLFAWTWIDASCHRLAPAVARIFQQTSGRYLQRLCACMRTALPDRATGARSAGRQVGASVPTHPPAHPCPLVSDPWPPEKGNMAEKARRVVYRFNDCAPRTHIRRYMPYLPIPGVQGFAHSKLIGSPTRITKHMQSAVPGLVSISPHPRTHARTQREESPGGRYARLVVCGSHGC
jgi:hypothetical protein